MGRKTLWNSSHECFLNVCYTARMCSTIDGISKKTTTLFCLKLQLKEKLPQNIFKRYNASSSWILVVKWRIFPSKKNAMLHSVQINFRYAICPPLCPSLFKRACQSSILKWSSLTCSENEETASYSYSSYLNFCLSNSASTAERQWCIKHT